VPDPLEVLGIVESAGDGATDDGGIEVVVRRERRDVALGDGETSGPR
jgi:hypothetical protein